MTLRNRGRELQAESMFLKHNLAVDWWQHSGNHATYEQQEAHEFFISMLDKIHDKEGKASLAIKSDHTFKNVRIWSLRDLFAFEKLMKMLYHRRCEDVSCQPMSLRATHLSFLCFGYEVSFKPLDKGAIEILSPYGISYTFQRLAEQISQLRSGFVVRRVHLSGEEEDDVIEQEVEDELEDGEKLSSDGPHIPYLHNYYRKLKNFDDVYRSCDDFDEDDDDYGRRGGGRSGGSVDVLIHYWWQHSENHATYEHQGAHEFFISMLDRIHDKEGKASLAIKSRKDFGSKSSKPIESLVGCLDLFTRPKELGSDQKLYSENCQEKQDTLKQMSIKKLPLVLCIHIK
ncbi:hypothetical protein H5410_041658 [Solanum commersonii]|uniref:USP domain-containing protein n=1 Tax=Solanum commersonii TaxID=4109 RepID=A0A9J5XVC8_SOLCO|nr:hypothetical protein H5410_041658 [Solanum commersonii]